MFKPIIHNLEKNHPSYEAIEKYNALISNKKLKGYTLAEKIISEKEWIKSCRNAFSVAVEKIQREGN